MPDQGPYPMDLPTPLASEGPVIIITNRKSGRNSRDREAVEAAAKTLGGEIASFSGGKGLMATIEQVRARRPSLVISAGGDGTAMAVANAFLGTDVAYGVLPLGTFNYFARGLGLSEDPNEAAQQLAQGRVIDITIGQVNGQAFLNNASVGIYPSILKVRETVYQKWGRRRIMAHWSVVKTFLRFRKPMKVRITVDGVAGRYRTALVFVARSAFQLENFRLEGTDAIKGGGFAVLLVNAHTRMELFRRVFKLALGTVEEGVDYDLFAANEVCVEVEGRKRVLLAYDGEKRRVDAPLKFGMSDTPLRLVVPQGYQPLANETEEE
ncbi:diacylglycerol kinase family enzyme [Sagittula marina]|uniref:Diacylglycerol kinase family enzyme n=1 Tax=Sagittula marina TaxID=943940 RepID=A0A7W6DPT5_9RHOB|nr:diacylglycerol kinase family protein [Sagittula marina]MBB3983788.1 diacylglycerol kinase family enzyme [Sagittula marina]